MVSGCETETAIAEMTNSEQSSSTIWAKYDRTVTTYTAQVTPRNSAALATCIYLHSFLSNTEISSI